MAEFMEKYKIVCKQYEIIRIHENSLFLKLLGKQSFFVWLVNIYGFWEEIIKFIGKKHQDKYRV